MRSANPSGCGTRLDKAGSVLKLLASLRQLTLIIVQLSVCFLFLFPVFSYYRIRRIEVLGLWQILFAGNQK